jgi:hypothetical protein
MWMAAVSRNTVMCIAEAAVPRLPVPRSRNVRLTRLTRYWWRPLQGCTPCLPAIPDPPCRLAQARHRGLDLSHLSRSLGVESNVVQLGRGTGFLG